MHGFGRVPEIPACHFRRHASRSVHRDDSRTVRSDESLQFLFVLGSSLFFDHDQGCAVFDRTFDIAVSVTFLSDDCDKSIVLLYFPVIQAAFVYFPVHVTGDIGILRF